MFERITSVLFIWASFSFAGAYVYFAITEPTHNLMYAVMSGLFLSYGLIWLVFLNDTLRSGK